MQNIHYVRIYFFVEIELNIFDRLKTNNTKSTVRDMRMLSLLACPAWTDARVLRLRMYADFTIIFIHLFIFLRLVFKWVITYYGL